MQLIELLSHMGESILHDRNSPVSGSSSPMWPDEVLVRYFVQAESLFARRTFCLLDSTTAAVCTVPLTAATGTYALHTSILKVFSVKVSDAANKALEHGHYNQMVQFMDQTGRPVAWATDEAYRKLTVVPVPDADAGALDLNLRVARLPLTPLTLTSLTASPEIPEEYHLDLCDWVAYKCLIHQDIDAEAQNDSQRYRAAFELAMKRARRDVEILTEPPSGFVFGGWGNDTTGYDDGGFYA